MVVSGQGYRIFLVLLLNFPFQLIFKYLTTTRLVPMSYFLSLQIVFDNHDFNYLFYLMTPKFTFPFQTLLWLFSIFHLEIKKKKNNPPQKKTPKVITTKAWFIIFSAFPPKLVYAQYTWTQRLIMISFKSCYLCYLISFPTELQWIVQSSWFYLNIYLIHLILSCLHYSHHLRPSSHHLPHALLQSLLNTLLDSILATLKFILHRGHRLLKMQIS